jgi:pentatricopeptide repeat protein
MCDAQGYTSVMSALLDRKRLVEAKEIFQRMEMDAVTPDAAAVSTLISGIARLGDVKEAEELYENSKRQYGVEPNMYSVTAIIAAYAEQVRV